MTAQIRPLLAFNPPHVPEGGRVKPKGRPLPKVAGPGGKRQGERLGPKFTELVDAFAAQRVEAGTDTPTEVDPSLVIVLDLAGSVQDFHRAVERIEGLEFLAEMLGEDSEPDDDFHMEDSKKGRTDKPVPHSLYLAMTNAKAVDQLISLFKRWQDDPNIKLEHGLSKFKDAFAQLADVRRWGPEDRIRETGLLRHWQETLAVVGQSSSPVRAEVELWYHRDRGRRSDAERTIIQILSDCGGRVVNRARIEEIGYHALLVELPRQQVEDVVRRGAQAIRLLRAEEVMFVSPFKPMSVVAPHPSQTSSTSFPIGHPSQSKPRIALFDGLPVQNHDALAGRILIDDADGVEGDYPVSARSHGTAMASLIIHGDLSAPGEPLERPLYVRPIMQPKEWKPGEYAERVLPDTLLVDLLHRAVRRLFVGESGRPAWAPSVRIINLSIGDRDRPLIRRMSPVGRLLDWLALKYNILFVVSAGNHAGPIRVPSTAARDANSAQEAASQAVFSSELLRGIYPPGDAMNAITVGAVHADAADEVAPSSTAWDLTRPDSPALYSATGPGVSRSIKPDLFHNGGRMLFRRPLPGSEEHVDLYRAPTRLQGPGVQVASPGTSGATDKTMFDCGTSHATALVTREASMLFDALEAAPGDTETPRFPERVFHPLLVRALLAHTCSWGDWQKEIAPQSSRKDLTPILGYGRLDPDRSRGAVNRAVVITGNEIGLDERHTYELPLPLSLRSKAEWHRFVITLAYWAPTTRGLNTYRAAKVYFTTPDMRLAGGDRVDADHHAVRRGSLQHEVIDGYKAMTFNDGDVFPIHVECMRDGQKSGRIERIRYALVVSIETAATTSSIIYDEVRAGLIQMHDRAGIQQTDRVRVR
ncbi:S8 family peptidase [Actinomyces sp.]|uniref:S8 family peptidase n=1 Tax=Actinomyces sp. TaxID=29317 RepID=UPI0026DAA047|nr:S8 family peptidase [Actinomyces sp.]MDO4900690.1 S8 family peptidase [Actinomyces sp.]